jgi:hypothetical protein
MAINFICSPLLSALSSSASSWSVTAVRASAAARRKPPPPLSPTVWRWDRTSPFDRYFLANGTSGDVEGKLLKDRFHDNSLEQRPRNSSRTSTAIYNQRLLINFKEHLKFLTFSQKSSVVSPFSEAHKCKSSHVIIPRPAPTNTNIFTTHSPQH